MDEIGRDFVVTFKSLVKRIGGRKRSKTYVECFFLVICYRCVISNPVT